MAKPEPSNIVGLSPLDQIRQAEAEVNRSYIAAQEQSEQKIASIRLQSVQLKKQALDSGVHKGLVRYKTLVSKAEEDASAIIARAQHQALEIHKKSSRHMAQAVRQAIMIVLGMEDDGGPDES